MLAELKVTRKIDETEEGYCIYFPDIMEYISDLKDEKIAYILTLRMQGKTLEEIGNKLNITRERVRQLTKKALENLPKLKELKYEYWYENYKISKNDFIDLFDITEESYNYLTLVYDSNGSKQLEEIFKDENLTINIARRAEKIMQQYSVLIGDEYVPIKREKITKKLLEKYCSETECRVTEFYKYYNDFLISNNLAENEKLQYTTEHAFEARIADCDYVLIKYGRKLRYYNILEYNVKDLFKNIGLENYDGLEISTLKLFTTNQELMQEYNIQDEYELHNLMKKCEMFLPDIQVVLGRMPFLTIGNANREKQVESFLFRVAPIELYDFATAYEEEYGIKSETVVANFIPYINQYCHNSMLTVNQEVMETFEYDEMKKNLVDDFYFISDIEKIYVDLFANGNKNKVNPYNLKMLGFLVYIDYIVKNIYGTAENYFRELLTRNNKININDLDKRICYNQGFNHTLEVMRTEYKLLEIEQNKYITFERFAQIAPGITTEQLKEYAISAAEYSKEPYFTICSIHKLGFCSIIDKLKLSEWFYGALLRSNKTIRYSKVGGGFLFAHSEFQIKRSDFFKYIVNKFKHIHIMDFISYIDENYGLKFDRYDITPIINSTSMFYSPETEVIYYSREDYLVEKKQTVELAKNLVCNDVSYKIEPLNNRKMKDNTYSKMYIEILKEFKKGYRVGSALEAKKFRKYYKEKTGNELLISDIEIDSEVINCGVLYENRVYEPSNMVDEMVSKKLQEYIQSIFDSGKNMLYYEAIYQDFATEFSKQQIYSSAMLKQYLEHQYKEQYYIKRYFMTNNLFAEVNPIEELKECLISNARSMTFEEIAEKLPHIPIDKIKSILTSNSEFIRNSKGSYFTPLIVYFSNDELYKKQ